MNYSDDVYDLTIKIYSEHTKDELIQLGQDIEEYLFSGLGCNRREVNVNFYVVKEDAVR